MCVIFICHINVVCYYYYYIVIVIFFPSRPMCAPGSTCTPCLLRGLVHNVVTHLCWPRLWFLWVSVLQTNIFQQMLTLYPEIFISVHLISTLLCPSMWFSWRASYRIVLCVSKPDWTVTLSGSDFRIGRPCRPPPAKRWPGLLLSDSFHAFGVSEITGHPLPPWLPVQSSAWASGRGARALSPRERHGHAQHVVRRALQLRQKAQA